MKLPRNLILFLIGGSVYVGLELIWRGWSHGTMFVLGGLCFLLIGHLGRQHPRPALPVRTALGVMICTAGELLFGLLFNRDYGIWDYRMLPGNLGGQICPQFTLLWIPVTLAAEKLYQWCDRRLARHSGQWKVES